MTQHRQRGQCVILLSRPIISKKYFMPAQEPVNFHELLRGHRSIDLTWAGLICLELTGAKAYTPHSRPAFEREILSHECKLNSKEGSPLLAINMLEIGEHILNQWMLGRKTIKRCCRRSPDSAISREQAVFRRYRGAGNQ
jgi:hypothetical protein